MFFSELMKGMNFIMLRLKDLREDHDLKQEYIAKILNISQTNYSKYELEKVNIPISSLIVLADFYNTSIDYLIGLTDEIKPYTRSSKVS
jgi:transcriptional regulator with XRE-family HTH domain